MTSVHTCVCLHVAFEVAVSSDGGCQDLVTGVHTCTSLHVASQVAVSVNLASGVDTVSVSVDSVTGVHTCVSLHVTFEVAVSDLTTGVHTCVSLHVAFEVAGSVEGGTALCALVSDQRSGSPLGVDQFVACEGTVPAKHCVAVRTHVGSSTGVTLAIGHNEETI